MLFGALVLAATGQAVVPYDPAQLDCSTLNPDTQFANSEWVQFDINPTIGFTSTYTDAMEDAKGSLSCQMEALNFMFWSVNEPFASQASNDAREDMAQQTQGINCYIGWQTVGWQYVIWSADKSSAIMTKHYVCTDSYSQPGCPWSAIVNNRWCDWAWMGH